MAGFAERDHFDLEHHPEANIAGYVHGGNGKQWSMPLNSSVPLLYYNKDGVPRGRTRSRRARRSNLDEIRADSEKLSKINGGPSRVRVRSGDLRLVPGTVLDVHRRPGVYCDRRQRPQRVSGSPR